MKRLLPLLIFSIIFCSCNQSITSADIPKLNGYWEIEKVVMPDSEDKSYSISDSFDYIEMKGDTGFRTKVMPQFNGTFETNMIKENIKVIYKDDKVFLNYCTPYAKWQEELVALSEKELVTVNSETKEYHYKKAGAINITGNGKKTK